MNATPPKTPIVRTGEGGFSLIEVLVSLVIIAVGMLGLAKLQALAYVSTSTSSQRSLAAIEASSIVSAIRANRDYWSAITLPLTVTVTGSATTATVTANNTQLSVALGTTRATTAGALPTYCQVGGGGAPCSAVLMAGYDLNTWATTFSKVLPSATATITCPATAVTPTPPVACTIQVSWLERNVAINSQSQGHAVALPTYTLYVVP